LIRRTNDAPPSYSQPIKHLGYAIVATSPATCFASPCQWAALSWSCCALALPVFWDRTSSISWKNAVEIEKRPGSVVLKLMRHSFLFAIDKLPECIHQPRPKERHPEEYAVNGGDYSCCDDHTPDHLLAPPFGP